ncbi:MAG TPA: Hsp70 family protein [Anaerolineae bacterium]|nr:Hsp70 family protein [Anaerolineae bacterium]
MIIGMDFGTTNSGISLFDNDKSQILPLDPSNRNPRVLRTALYIPNDQNVVIGRAAIDQYFEQNVGRAINMQRVWVGEIEVRGGDMYYVTDVYVWIDVLSPGRLFLSFKTSLRDASYHGTVVGQAYYSLEDLVTLYLYTAKKRAEHLLGHPLTEVVLGRPVRFAFDPEQDKLAQARLLTAAFRAGYNRVFLQQEPIAAAYHYAHTQTTPQNILIFDFGGGTLDVTAMRIDGPQRHILATGGIPVAGDIFDQKLLRATLPPHFGEGSHYGPRDAPLPVPLWIYDIFSDWQNILELQIPDNKRLLDEIRHSAHRPHQIDALINLVSSNYGLNMFDAVEQAKRELSDRIGTMIRLDGPGFNVMELVTRNRFEAIIRPEIVAIDRHLDEILNQASLSPDKIDTVIRTGGSAQIPAFQNLLATKFAPDKIRSADTFSSVTAGLGIIGHQLNHNQIDLPEYTPANHNFTVAPPEETKVAPINLTIIKNRIAQRETPKPESATAQLGLAILTDSYHLPTTALPTTTFATSTPLDIPADLWGEIQLGGARAAYTAPLDTPFLLVTNHYRFIHITLRQLAEFTSLNVSLNQRFTFDTREHITALAPWHPLKQQPRLVIVTDTGYIRHYPVANLIPLFEGPIPHRFDQPPTGWPIALLGTDDQAELIMVTRNGRGLRQPLNQIRAIGQQTLSTSRDDDVITAHITRPFIPHLLITASGHARQLPARAIPIPPQAKDKGKSLISRKPTISLVPTPATPLWLLTNQRLIPLSPTSFPPTDATSTKSHRLLKLHKDEQALTTIT